MLNESDAAFLIRRRRFARAWNVAGSALLVLLGAALGWMIIDLPRLVNPMQVLAEIRTGALMQSTALLMAATLPVMVLASFLLALAVVLAGFAMFALERRYQRIVGELVARGPGANTEDPVPGR